MSEFKKLYDDFWASFITSHSWPNDQIGSPDKPVHTSKGKPNNYYDFDQINALGFRATATISAQKDQLRAELSTDKRGIGFVEYYELNKKRINSPSDLQIFTHSGKSDAKVEIVWDNAGIQCRELWPAHHLWLKCSLEILSRFFNPIIEEYGDTH